ncbi:hypothetical protein K492DRAFT_239386 [Lichtheimia hyalospora FSU 10163]|nr:hypothetical protein K492DRAFT_239386 [Lichtheimia hyalospora FSU 10163]
MPVNDNHTSTTQFTMAHRLSNHDRSYTRLLVTPPSPPYSSTPPEYRRLKEDMVLRWVNYQLGCTPAVTRLADIYNHDAFVKLIHTVSSQHCPRQRSTKSSGTPSYQAVVAMLKDWIGHDSGYNLETLVRDDPDQLLSFILTQHQAHIIHKIQSTLNTFIIPKDTQQQQQSSCAEPFQIKQVLLSWAQTCLTDYVDACLLPLVDNCNESWQDGLAFLALVHRYDPGSVQDLPHFVAHNVDNKVHWEHTLTTAFRRAHDTFQVPVLLDAHLLATALHVDEEPIIAYLVEFLRAVYLQRSCRSIDECEQYERQLRGKRQADIEQWCTAAATSRTTSTTCNTQLRLTRVVQTMSVVKSPSLSLSHDDQQQSTSTRNILDKIEELHQRLMNIAPTRSTHYNQHQQRRRRRRQSSCTTMPDSPVPSEQDSLTTNDITSSSTDTHPLPLHPLQAGYEDLRSYEQNFAGFQVSLQAFQQDDDTKGWLSGDTMSLSTGYGDTIQEAYATLMQQVDQASHQLDLFRRGFFFGRQCADIRSELDAIQTKMLKTTPASSDNNIHDLGRQLEHATTMLNELHDNDMLCVESIYRQHMDSLIRKKERVQSWVDEVRVWFAEAKRIREWIEIRMQRLEKVAVPVEPLKNANLAVSRVQVEQLNAEHEMLEQEIESFDKQDMARLRAHVNKSLTSAVHEATTTASSSNDLSPADTTTIEITLTTLTLREKLMSMLRRKRDDLDVLTQRLTWEEELDKTQAWIKDTDKQVETFIRDTARWQLTEDDIDTFQYRQQDHFIACERLKELVIQRLLILEKKRTEFDQGQFTTTIDSYNDLEDIANVDALPDHLEARQSLCERQFEDLFKRINFSRHVVEQRLKMMEFLNQAHSVKHDAQQLVSDLQQAQEGDKDAISSDCADMVSHVQSIHDRIAQLVAASGMTRIPYPQAALASDQEENTHSNAAIHTHVEKWRHELLLLDDHVDTQLDALQQKLTMNKHNNQLLDEATRLYHWADDRMQHLKKARSDATSTGDTLSADDLRRLERERDYLLTKLKDGKEDEAIDVLTRIQAFVEQVPRVKITVHTQTLEEMAQHLTKAFDQLRDSLEDYTKDLAILRKRADNDSSHISKIHALKAYISDTCASLPALKQSYGFMTGRSQEQDQKRFNMLQESVDGIMTSFREQSQQLQMLKDELYGDSDHVDNAEDVYKAMDNTLKEWDNLSNEIDLLQQFTKNVERWYERQRRLSIVEHEYLDKQGTLSAHCDNKNLDKAISLLEEIGTEITSAGEHCRTDPLEAANHACAYDRHATLMKQAQVLQSERVSLEQASNDATMHESMLHDLNILLSEVQHENERMRQRLAIIGQCDFASMSMDEIGKLYQQLQRDTTECVALISKCRQQLTRTVLSDTVVQEHIDRVDGSLAELEISKVMIENQVLLVRKIQVHAEAANNLDTWISQCNNAVAQFANADARNTADELQEQQDAIGRKLAVIQPVVRSFQAMQERIFSGKIEMSTADSNTIKAGVQAREDRTMESYRQLLASFDDAKAKMQSAQRDADVAHIVKDILTLVGEYKDRTNALRLGKAFMDDIGSIGQWNDLKMVTCCSLSMMPNENELRDYKNELSTIEQDIERHLQKKLDDLDTILGKAVVRSKKLFSAQRAEIAMAVRGLADLLKMKHNAALTAEKVEPFLNIAEEIDVMLSALSEAVDRTSPSQARIVDGLPSRADLQAMLIDLDTQFRYYQPKINHLLKEAYGVAQIAIRDKRVEDCLGELKYKWIRLQQQVTTRHHDLASRFGPVGRSFMSTRLTSANINDQSKQNKRMSMPCFNTAPLRSIQSTPKPVPKSRARPQSMLITRATASPVRRPPTTPTPELLGSRQQQHQQFPLRNRRNTTTTVASEAYVADPKNDLDVAVGNIVNDSPYKVRIKKVPGEVGRYWFGKSRPKLAYCRILGSRMVMVRVGGGWVELSQFLRDQKLLEDGRYIPRDASSSPINTGNNVVTLCGGDGINSRSSSPLTKRGVKSPTSPHPVSSPLRSAFGHGIKDGNKALIPIDKEGNQVQVRMTKAKSNSTKFITPWR